MYNRKPWKVFPLCRPWDEEYCGFSGCLSVSPLYCYLIFTTHYTSSCMHTISLLDVAHTHSFLSLSLFLSLYTHTGSPIFSYIHTGLAMDTSPLTTTPYTNTDAYTYTFLHETIPDVSLWFPFTFTRNSPIPWTGDGVPFFFFTKIDVTWQLHLMWYVIVLGMILAVVNDMSIQGNFHVIL